MGLFNWLQKNGPGSPGSTAKAIAKLYKSLPKYNSPYPGYVDKYHGFAEIVDARKLVEKESGLTSLLTSFETKQLVSESMGDMGLLIFQIMYLETSQFRASLTSEDMVKSTMETIRLVIHEVLPDRLQIEERMGTYSSNFVSAIGFMLKHDYFNVKLFEQ